MPLQTFGSREFNQDTGKADQAASDEPVFITNRGRLAHVLLSSGDSQGPVGAGSGVVDALTMPGAEDIEFAPPRAQGFSRPTDLSC